jgi:hypothetical protein
LADKGKANIKPQELKQELDKLNKRLDMLDQRLDNMDSVVSAVVERVMSQPISIGFTCPKCGKSAEIAIIGNQKPGVNKG